MPVFEQGYRVRERAVRRKGPRFWPITRTCFRAAIGKHFALVLVVAAFPLLRQILVAYALGAEGQVLPQHVLAAFGFRIDGALFFDLLSTEIFFGVLMLGAVGAGQIAEDFRTGALQLYFAKPITQTDYILGKLGTMLILASLVTIAPGIVLLLSCLAFAPDLTFLTGDPLLPLKVLAFSAIVALVLSTVALAVSSVTRRGRSAGLLFLCGYVLTMALSRVLPRILADSRWEVLHIGNALDAVGTIFFGPNPDVHAPVDLACGLLGALTLLSVFVLARRVNAVEVVR